MVCLPQHWTLKQRYLEIWFAVTSALFITEKVISRQGAQGSHFPICHCQVQRPKYSKAPNEAPPLLLSRLSVRNTQEHSSRKKLDSKNALQGGVWWSNDELFQISLFPVKASDTRVSTDSRKTRSKTHRCSNTSGLVLLNAEFRSNKG